MDEWCRTYIEEYHLDKVHLMGFVPNNQVKQLIGESKALILPTQVYEGFPMTIAESYACGTPVIGSDLGNTGSLIEEGVSGWRFSYKSAEALADCVRKAEKWNTQFPEEIRQKYSIEENYRRLWEIYKNIS